MRILSLLLLLVFFSPDSGSQETQTNAPKSERGIRQPVVLSFHHLQKLPPIQKQKYLKNLAEFLVVVDSNLQDSRPKSSHWLQKILWETAHAGQFLCIGGGVFIDSGAPHCGTSSYAGFTCPAGQDICNPLIFGVHDDGRPVCHPTATTNWCYKNTKPGYTTRLDLVYEKAGSAQAWANFQRDTAMICNNKNYSKVEETVDQVTRACKRIVRQTQINQSRLDRGWDGAKSLKNDKGFYALYQNDTAGSGKCVAPLKEEPLKVLKRNGMSYVGNPTGSELKALATGIRQIERLLGHPIKRNWQTTFRYVNSGGTWNYGISSSGNVTVKRRTGHGGANNISRYMHELGHKVGWSGYYDRFSNYPGTTSCKVSPYASYSRNERFAETFAAFVTYPELLKERCPSAFNFFAKEVFSNGQKSSALALCNREKPRPKGSWINKLFKKGTQ